MRVPPADCHCAAIQDFAWAQWSTAIDVVIDVWTLSYLYDTEVLKVLLGISRALKPGGVLILCLPIRRHGGDEEEQTDVGMYYRELEVYEAFFKIANLVHHPCLPEPQNYEPVTDKSDFDQGREAVWILRPGN